MTPRIFGTGVRGRSQAFRCLRSRVEDQTWFRPQLRICSWSHHSGSSWSGWSKPRGSRMRLAYVTAGALFRSEVYWHKVPKLAYWSCWWCAPWWCQFIFGDYGVQPRIKTLSTPRAKLVRKCPNMRANDTFRAKPSDCLSFDLLAAFCAAGTAERAKLCAAF